MQFNTSFHIGSRTISQHSPAFIIAEAGVNHNGDMELAKKLIDAASAAGADAVKFQSFKTEKLILKDIKKALYQTKTTSQEESQYEMLKRLEVEIEKMAELQDYCCKKGITFLSTPFDEESLEELHSLNVPAVKVAATDLTNIKFLRQIARLGKPVLLSAGMCYMEEVEKALECIYPINKDVVLLQCTANYPIADIEANLQVIRTFQEKFSVLVGYSDHSQGVGASPYAAALGAKVIEKHFTLDKNMPGPDHKASVTPPELEQLVKEIRRAELYLGDGVKMPSCSEQQTRKSLQKSLVAKTKILAGESFSEGNVEAKRTGGQGISAIYYDKIIGSTAVRDFEQDDIITLD